MLWRILDIHVTLSLKDCPLLQSSYNLYIFVLAFSSHKHEYLETFCFRADQSFNTSKNECFFSQWLNIQCLEKVFILSELEMILDWVYLWKTKHFSPHVRGVLTQTSKVLSVMAEKAFQKYRLEERLNFEIQIILVDTYFLATVLYSGHCFWATQLWRRSIPSADAER